MQNEKRPVPVAGRVLVLDRLGRPLDPCHPARARRLLADGQAAVVRRMPFVIRLKDRSVTDPDTVVHAHRIKIDPGSRHTGIALARPDESGGGTHGVLAVQVEHRGGEIHKSMLRRAQLRRGRRTRNLRYRKPRFDNRRRPEGWLAPSLRHRVESTMGMVERLRRWAPVVAVELERMRFDTQLLQNPEIRGVEYQRGTLAGYEVWEYLLEKWGHRCAYCDASGVPLTIDHVHPRSEGGSDRVSNLVAACVDCNEDKGNRPVEEFLADDPERLPRIRAQLKKPLKDAAAVNSIRKALEQALLDTGLPVSTSTGGRTKWNRWRMGLTKSHTLDALCVGDVERIVCYAEQIIVAAATGRGSYSRTRSDAHGFPRLRLLRVKRVHGFQTGDLVRAVLPSGQKAGAYVGRVAVRSRGRFLLRTAEKRIDGISYRHCKVVQRNDGWSWSSQPERSDRV